MTKQSINTRTQEEYDALMGTKKAKIWEHLSRDIWGLYGENTCIDFEGNNPAYADIEYYQSLGYTIIPYTEFAKANIVEEPDFKALYLESKDVIEKIDAALKMDRSNDGLNEVRFKIIRKYLNKHNVTPNN